MKHDQFENHSYFFTEEEYHAASVVSSRYSIPISMACEYIDEWIKDGCVNLDQATKNQSILYLFMHLNLSVPAAKETLSFLRKKYNITVYKELPGTLWTCLYGDHMTLGKARKIYGFYYENSINPDFSTDQYDQYLSMVEEGYSREEALEMVNFLN